MKKFLFALILLLTGCTNTGVYDDSYYDFVKTFKEAYAHSYKPSKRLIKRILYYSTPEEVLKQFNSSFDELHYVGKIVTAVPSDYYILVACKNKDRVETLYLDYDDSIIYIDGHHELSGKYLFWRNSSHFKHYVIIRKRWKPEKDWIYWKIDEYEKGY